jgi:membrane protease YdiL (CAAX protease family)
VKGPETETVVETDGKNGDISQSYEAGQLHANDGTLSSMRFENSDASIQTTDIPQLPDPPKIDSARYIALSIAAAISAVVYSIILFSLASPEISDIVQQKLGGDVPVTNNTQVIVGLLVLLEYAFAEEIVFRLGIRNFLAKIFNWRKEKYWIAIFLTTILWTFGHTGILEPNWVKLVQVFPFGLVLGWLYKQQGTESCIFTHAIFNVMMAGISPLLSGQRYRHKGV